MRRTGFLFRQLHADGFTSLTNEKSALYLEGNAHLTVTGCRSIAAYDAQTVLLRMQEGLLRVTGDDLRLEEMLGGRIRITGSIETVTLPNSEHKNRP